MSSLSKAGPLLLKVAAVVVVLIFVGDLARAQEEPYPKWEAFGGYSFVYPNSRLHAINPIVDANQEANPRGLGGALTYNFNRWFGMTVDASGTPWGSGETPAQLALLDDAQFYNLSIGPKLTYRRKHFAPFLEGLVGWHRLTEDHVPLVGSSDTWGFMLGGGVDVPLTKHFGLRLLRADFVFSNHQFPPETLVGSTDVRGLRAQTGVIFMWGGAQPIPPSASCSVNPGEVMVGEGVTVNATARDFNPRHTLDYAWTSSGGKVSGTGATAQVDTSGVAGGTYSARAHITDPKNRKMMADCSVSFAVKEPPKNPPVISCSANPGVVQSGQSSLISCTCTSPDNAQLQPLAWTTSAGHLGGEEGLRATLDTAGLGASSVSVSTTCTDVRGLSSSTTTNVNVEVPQKIEASKINECSFPNTAKPARVDNACKAALDDVSLRLQREPDARAVIVGEAEAGAKPANLAAQRAFNTKDYLVQEKQTDASRLETRTGTAGGPGVEIYIVPAGATFDVGNTTVVTAPEKPLKKK